MMNRTVWLIIWIVCVTVAANVTVLIVEDLRLFAGQLYETMHPEANDAISK